MNFKRKVPLILGFPVFVAILVSLFYINMEKDAITVADPLDCMITGCSGELCANERTITTCRFKPEFTCYKRGADCELQESGRCGWTMTDELTKCLDQRKRMMMNLN